jgi:cell division protein FtsI (penicillin-binding protein 3)
MIYDRNWREMAADIEVESFFANPSEIKNFKQTAKVLAEAFNMDQKFFIDKLKTGKNFVWLMRQALPECAARLKEKNVEGIGSIKEYKRFYPKREMASRLIGFSGLDLKGLAGVEHSYNEYLRGGGRWIVMEKDAKGRLMRSVEIAKESREFKQSDIVLTIDETIQHIAEKALREKVVETGAKAGIAVVMNPNTGEILAMADYPTFNLNQYTNYSADYWRNKVVSNAYEPGSTFKVFLAASAIESGIDPNSKFYCENGELKVGSVAIHEASRKKFEWLTLVDIIKKSSNIGAIKIGQKLGKERYYEFIEKFGFGAKTGIDLEGEATGLNREKKSWTPLSLCSIAMGQEISTTPIQIITALSAIANGGFLLRPRVVNGIYKNGKPLKLFEPEIVRRVISKKTSLTMTALLSEVVMDGTGQKAGLDGYSVVGKTGTAQKFDRALNAYSKTKYLASFAGYFPAENPQVAILVMVDEPKTVFWGGSVAAPVFHDIALQTARYLNIPSKQGRVIWVNGFDPEIAGKASRDYFQDEEEEFEDNGIFSGGVADALARLKSSPHHYNDLQMQRKL